MMIIISEKDLKGIIVYEVGGGGLDEGVYRPLEPKKFVTVTLRWTRESTSPVYVEGFKTLYLRMRRFESCFAHFFVLVV